MVESTAYPEKNAEFWEARYQEGTARWDLNQPAPPLVSLLNSPEAPTPGKMIVMGSGNGHDALLFAEYGFEVTGVDFAPSAIAHAHAQAESRQLPAQFLQRDIFSLADDFSGQFDYVLEHTCFCAIAPDQREAYVSLAYALLKPDGEFIGLFWAHNRTGGPPYGTCSDEIRTLFAPAFTINTLDSVHNSVPNRAPDEYLGRFVRRDNFGF
jgi:SAM-dependent methyltransferase